MARSPLDHIRSLYIKEGANIDSCPTLSKVHIFDKDAQLTIGDLHGNALKLIYFLMKHCVILGISATDYRHFVKLYKKDPKAISKKDLKWFNSFINKIKVKRGGIVRLIGDDLADRGANDYFTLKILQKLFINGVNVEIMLSNHAGEFIEAHERGIYKPHMLMFGQAASLSNLNILIKRGLIDRKEVQDIVNKQYLKHLKVISYDIDKSAQRITLFTHAPVGLEAVRGIARRLGVRYRDKSMKELSRTIDTINKVFVRDYAKKGRISTLFDAQPLTYDPDNINPKTHPFAYLMWNRNYKRLERPQEHYSYGLKFIHGHDPRGVNIEGRIYNLDNALGKALGLHEGRYHIHFINKKMARLGQRKALQALSQKSLFSYSVLDSLAMVAPVALLGAYYFAYSAITIASLLTGMGASLGFVAAFTLRNQLYRARAKEMRAHKPNGEERRIFELGQQAASNLSIYAGSFADFSAWRNYRTFGVGMKVGEASVENALKSGKLAAK